MRNLFLSVLAIAILALSACNNNGEATAENAQPVLPSEALQAEQKAVQEISQKNATPSELDGSYWKLIAMTYEGEEFPLRPEPEESLNFANWRIMGGGCKRFSGIFDSEGPGQISVSNFRSSPQRCPSVVTPQERRLHDIIENANSYQLTPGTLLVINSEKGSATFGKP